MNGNDMDWVLPKLRDLRTQYADSEGQLLEIERRRVHLQDTMLRLSGAIHVLEEFVAVSGVFAPDTGADTAPSGVGR